MKSEYRNSLRKIYLLISLSTKNPTVTSLELNLKFRERLTTDHLNHSLVALRVCYYSRAQVCCHRDSHRTEKKEGKLHRKLKKRKKT